MNQEPLAMMETEAQAFGPLPPVTLEDLIPPDHFYRHLERLIGQVVRLDDDGGPVP